MSSQLAEKATEPTTETSTLEQTNGPTLEKTNTPASLGETAVGGPTDKEVEVAEGMENSSTYEEGWRLVAITLCLLLAVLLFALDQTIVATAIPRITDDFRALDSIGWIGSGYFLTVCAFQPIIGSFYAIFSKKWVFMISITIFEIGSLICGVSPNINVLIFGRCFQGLGAAGLYVGALTIIADIVPVAKRPAYQGIIGAAFGIASVIGPILGGVFTDSPKLTWRWCFYINLPVGGLALLVILLVLKSNKPLRPEGQTVGQALARLDWAGAIILLGAVACLLIALQYGGNRWAWNDGRIITLFVVAGVLAIAFICVQAYMGDRAIIPPRLLKIRTIIVVVFFSFCIGISFFTIVYFLPVYFQAVKGVDATRSGIDNLPFIFGVVVFSIVTGLGITKTGYVPPFMIAGGIFALIGSSLIHSYTDHSNDGMLYGYQALAGIGFGLLIQTPVIAVQTVLKGNDVPQGTAIAIFGQTLGGAIGIAIGSSVLNTKLASEIPKYAPNANLSIVLAGATQIRNLPADILPGVIKGYVAALDFAFIAAIPAAAAILILAFFVEWKNIKGKELETAA